MTKTTYGINRWSKKGFEIENRSLREGQEIRVEMATISKVKNALAIKYHI